VVVWREEGAIVMCLLMFSSFCSEDIGSIRCNGRTEEEVNLVLW
jgi:hypothetical protein